MKKYLTFVILISVIIVGVAPNVVVKADPSSTADKIKDAEEENEKDKDKLDDTKDEITDIESEKKDLNGILSDFNKQLEVVTANLADVEEQIAAKEEEIESTVFSLNEAKETEAKQKEDMKTRLKFMYMNGDEAYLELLFSSTGFSDFINKAKYIVQLSVYDNEQLEKCEATTKMISALNDKLIEQKSELDDLYVNAVEEQNKFYRLVEETKDNINTTQYELDAAEAEALALEKEIEEQEKNITELRKQYEAELAMSDLAANAAWRDISQVTFSEGDRYLFASLIYCEAGGEPYEGQLAVGAVVINRVLSSKYPDTLTGVIYQPHQFSPANSYGGYPPRLTIALQQNKATPSCYRAADEAMKGYSNVANCLYFRTPIEGKIPKYTIGGHIFY